MSDFLCPKCMAHIRIGDHIIFKVKTAKSNLRFFCLVRI